MLEAQLGLWQTGPGESRRVKDGVKEKGGGQRGLEPLRESGGLQQLLPDWPNGDWATGSCGWPAGG